MEFGAAVLVNLKRGPEEVATESRLQRHIGFPLLMLQHRAVVCETGC